MRMGLVAGNQAESHPSKQQGWDSARRRRLWPSPQPGCLVGCRSAWLPAANIRLSLCCRQHWCVATPPGSRTCKLATHHTSPAPLPCGDCLASGFFPTLLEDVPDMAVKFAAYESMRQLHKQLNDGRSASPQVGTAAKRCWYRCPWLQRASGRGQ